MNHFGALTLHQLQGPLLLFHKELTGASQVIEAGDHQPSYLCFAQISLFCSELLKPLHLHHSLQGNFTDIILITSHKSHANQEMNNTSSWWESWNWNPDSGPATALCCFHVLFTDNKALLHIKKTYACQKTHMSEDEIPLGGIWLRMGN